MSDEFVDYLTSIQAQRDTIQQGLRLYLAERTDDLPIEEMQTVLRDAISESQWQAGLRQLTSDSELTEAAALAVLSADWEDPARRPAIRSALENARKKLPVMEALILVTPIMYGMYLLATGGKKKSKRVSRDKNGKFVSEEIEYASPSPWLETLLKIFRRDS